MTERTRSVLLTLLLVVSTFSTVGVGAASAATTDEATFHVEQGNKCYEVSAMGNGEKSVAEFYDYRKPQNTGGSTYTYSSHGTKALQDNQVSNVFLYHGTEGYSIVLLHDKLDEDEQDAPYGSTVTFTFSNMGDVTWEVRDDNYTEPDGDPQDDNWDVTGSTHEVDWMWRDHRTDGGAFSGVADDEITITPQFNEDAPHWDDPDAPTGNQQPMETWRLLGESGTTVTELNMDQSLTVQQGSCSDDTSDETKPTAALSASPETAQVGETVSFDAGGSSDGETSIVEYRWDFDGDGNVDDTTTDPTASYTYQSSGSYDASVTVVDDGGNTDAATATVTVESADNPPNAALSVSPNPANTSEEVEFDASGSSDDGNISWYEMDFDGDGTTDYSSKDNATVFYAYESPGSYEATVTVYDDAGQSDTATVTVEVTENDSAEPTVTVDYPETVNVGETFEVSATASDESKIESYEWDFGSKTKTGSAVTHSYVEAGNHSVTFTWTETDGESTSRTFTIEAEPNESATGESITYLNGTAVRVNGTFEQVDVHVSYYTSSGIATSYKPRFNVSGSTLITTKDEGINGTMITLVEAYEEAPSREPTLSKKHPQSEYYAEAIEPRPVTVSVENVTEVGNGTYDVTFAYDNPNEEMLRMSNSTFSGNVTGEAPTEFESGENNFTVSWTPDSDSERAVWTLNRSKFDQSDVSARTKTAGELAGDETDATAPEAALTALPSFGTGETTFTFRANDSTDDRGVVRYEWDFDDDGDYETTTDDPQVRRTYSETGRHEVTVRVSDAAGNADTASTNVTVFEFVTEPSVEFVNESAVNVTGEFDVVNVTAVSFTADGRQTTTHTFEDVAGTTLLTLPDGATWGPVAKSVAAYENASNADPTMTADNPDFASQVAEVRPEKVSTYFDGVEEDNGTYEVTFGYVNPNDHAMNASASAFTAGNVSGTPPTTFAPGRHTVTVTWTPTSNDSNLVWRTDFSNFGYGASTTTSPTPDQIGDGEMPPTAALTATPTTVAPGETVTLDASGSADDGNVTEYRWDLDGDGEYERTTQKAKIGHVFRVTGTYDVVVAVVDDSGQIDTATDTVVVHAVPTDDAPTAHLTVPDEASADDIVVLDASESTDDRGIVWYKYYADGELLWAGNPNARPDITSLNPQKHLDGTGTYQLTVKVWDNKGQSDTASETVTITAADGNSGGDPGSPGDGGSDPGDDPPESGIGDDDDPGNRNDDIGVTDPGNDDQRNDGQRNADQQNPATVSEPLNDGGDRIGEVVLKDEDGSDPAIDVTDAAPDGVEAPTVAEEGFAPLSYVTVGGADRATVTVSKDRLDQAGAVPEDVALFRYENGSWTAVETIVVNETDDAVRFRANVSDGTYAVGLERPVTDVADVSVGSQRVETGESVTVTATVENDGRADGTHEVELSVGGEVVATKTVSVAAGATKEVTFSRTFDASGVYEVGVGSATTEVVVKGVETATPTTTADESDESGPATSAATETTENDGDIPGFGVGASLVALLAAALVALRRR